MSARSTSRWLLGCRNANKYSCLKLQDIVGLCAPPFGETLASRRRNAPRKPASSSLVPVKNQRARNGYGPQVPHNGQKLTQPFLAQQDVAKSGVLVFVMGRGRGNSKYLLRETFYIFVMYLPSSSNC